jgi:membrane-associated HD superfamily phosphohydrolase
MRQMTYAAAAVMLVGALACSPRDRQETANRTENAAEDVRDATREGAEDVRDEARDARDYAYAQRNDFRRDVDLRLRKLDKEVSDVERSTERGVDKAHDSLLVEVRAARKAVSRDLDRLGSATEASWDDAKNALNRSVYSFQESVRRLRPDARPMGGTGPS